MTSRRRFLATLPALSASAVLMAEPSSSPGECPDRFGVAPTTVIPLEKGWLFRLVQPGSANEPAEPAGNDGWQSVTVPHTWQTITGMPGFVGFAWYKLEFDCPEAWKQQFVRVEFEAVFHTARVTLNGDLVGEHSGKGYTAFTCDLSSALKFGRSNTLLVRVDNTPMDGMLPRMESFDWANDGGLIRPVSLLVTPRIFIERIEVDATPNLERNTAEVKIRAVVRNTLDTRQAIRVEASVRREGTASETLKDTSSGVVAVANTWVTVALPAIPIESPALWHFDAPHLYVATVDLHTDGGPHRHVETFGIRKFEARGAEFYLNGEPVRLMGVERMAGSHPELGMAEPNDWIEANHRDMKELNCVFTRVHWAQDKRVLDFCDRNGILMQEEVPAWGEIFSKVTDTIQHHLVENGLEQLREMIARDRNHPSIVSWGLCNEVDGKNPRTRDFALALAAEARKVDPSRLLTYASNSLGERPEDDMAGEFDFISTNEYYGSWAPGGPADVRAHMERICRAFPNKPIVVSEYGWCECQPSIPAGDEHRIEIVDGHTEVFREFPQVAGAIYFDYNDYRTLAGDKGVGSFRQRVHGVVDLYANRKPSFQALRLQASPIEFLSMKQVAPDHFSLSISARKTLPAYTLRGYRARWVVYGYDGLPMEGRIDELAAIKPGGSVEIRATFNQTDAKRIVVDILRPTGFSVATEEWRAS
jgi:beta-galactosidase